MTKVDLQALLTGGDRRMVCGVDEAVQRVLAQPDLLAQLIDGMQADDPLVRMRSADAVEKITAKHPDWLQPHKRFILNAVAKSDQQEVRWHVAQLISRFQLTAKERKKVYGVLIRYLGDNSSIVRVFSMQALADLAEQDPELKSDIVPRITQLTEIGTPAMRSRGKKLLQRLAET